MLETRKKTKNKNKQVTCQVSINVWIQMFYHRGGILLAIPLWETNTLNSDETKLRKCLDQLCLLLKEICVWCLNFIIIILKKSPSFKLHSNLQKTNFNYMRLHFQLLYQSTFFICFFFLMKCKHLVFRGCARHYWNTPALTHPCKNNGYMLTRTFLRGLLSHIPNVNQFLW